MASPSIGRPCSLQLASCLGLLLLSLPPAAAERKEQEKTPYPCKEKYDAADVEQWVAKHLSSVPEGNAQPQMLLMMGGSGSGKGTFLKRWLDVDVSAAPVSLKHFVQHGLDEYLEYIPEYAKTLQDPENVYKDAADACYPGASIPAAKLATDMITSRKIHLIYEETGKNLDRIKKRVLPPFVQAGYRITAVFVDNDAETAIARAAGRFRQTGRYAPDDYIRGTFSNSFESYEALKGMDEVKEAVYCDNSGKQMRCWADGKRPEGALVPAAVLEKGQPQHRKPNKSDEL